MAIWQLQNGRKNENSEFVSLFGWKKPTEKTDPKAVKFINETSMDISWHLQMIHLVL